MNFSGWKKDRFVSGLVLGAVLLLIFYFAADKVRYLFVLHYNDPYIFAPPRVQLVAMALTLICFRLLLLNFNRERTAKGVLFTTVLATFAYFIWHYKLK
ncbi:MAG: hypothetical protein DWQ44_08110 [Bacteroidetes bacterium]|nr:MAG: hypothetical protein DWQ33_01510 [Bacteroidota bacterium]REK07053.1 MAG: hypothetical protein DWQ39_02580 [Bacteroidota bacterium]REK33601.1 MAG: hypothetical protein DWQ44_08110 [Bacteroidota bacterium]REK48585.1 MAG: hypothetical protein DWQ48_09545 [Bacteroidota bacterium]